MLLVTFRRPSLALLRRLAKIPVEHQATTAITLAELLYGAVRRGADRLLDRIDATVPESMIILPFDRAAAEIFGPPRARLESEGRRIDEPDLRIAAIALARDLTVVTGNVRHFRRIPGLRVENWLAE